MAVPESHPGQVYKSRNYVDVIVNKGGSVSVSGPISWALNIGAGWKNKAWLADLHAKGDDGWDALFAASDTKPDCLKKTACSQ